jgi:predicted acylesterase/phospholipase RssA
MEDLIIYSLPVSGGAFTNQLALLSELYEALAISKAHKIQPDIALGSSGGNIAIYTAMAGDWTSSGINRVVRLIERELFIRSWFSLKFIPTILAGLFTGSVYRDGYGGNYMFKKFFTEESIQRTEVWTGTYNITTSRAEFFCNKTKNTALIQDNLFVDDRDLFGAMHLHYMGSQENLIKKLSTISVASASIPYLVKCQTINGHEYQDGGVVYASPTLALKNEIHNLITGDIKSKLSSMGIEASRTKRFNVLPGGQILAVKRDCDKRQRRFCHYYFGSHDMDSVDHATYAKRNSPHVKYSQVINASILIDRSAGIDILRALAGDRILEIKHLHYQKINFLELSKLLTYLQKRAEHYSCALYPYGSPAVKLTTFTTFDIINTVKCVRKHYGINVWYLPYARS